MQYNNQAESATLRKNLLTKVNDSLRDIQAHLRTYRVEEKEPRPGLTFFARAPTEKEDQENAAPFLVIQNEDSKFWVCCKISTEVLHVGPFDILLDPDEWSGGYSIILEAWNPALFHEKDLDEDFFGQIPQKWLNRVLELYKAYQKNGHVPEDLVEFVGSTMEEADDRWRFQAKESDTVERVRRYYHEKDKTSVFRQRPITSHKIQSVIIDDRIAAEIPFKLARAFDEGQVRPVLALSVPKGDWLSIEPRGYPTLNCLVSSARVTPAQVETIASEQSKWSKINSKILSILSQPEYRDKIRDLERLLRKTDYDPYVAFNLAWLFFFVNEKSEAIRHVAQAEKGLRSEFLVMAQNLEILLSDLSEKAISVQSPMVDVWWIRCHVPGPFQRIQQMKVLFERIQHGYVAYELAREYKHLGSIIQTPLKDYEHYQKARHWAEKALQDDKCLDQNMKKWPQEIVDKIGVFDPSIPRPVDSSSQDIYVL